jgi:hypothetical protein
VLLLRCTAVVSTLLGRLACSERLGNVGEVAALVLGNALLKLRWLPGTVASCKGACTVGAASVDLVLFVVQQRSELETGVREPVLQCAGLR